MKNKKPLKPKHALLILNTALLVVLGVVTLGPSANAQNNRSRGQYIMVGGKSAITQPGVAYILDQSSQELISVSWNDSSKVLTGVGYQSVSKVIEQSQKTR